ncbi:MAG: hypothetical protein ACODAG_04475 [Myxococcota bacterium]
MISGVLRNDIEAYVQEARATNPLYHRILDGSLEREKVGRYLVNVLHLLRHTPPYLERARQRARERGQRELADYFDQKLDEEVGHDQWAVSDIHHFTTVLNVRCRDVVMPSLASMLAYLGDVIDEDPTLYLAYILFAEYVTVLEGPALLELLEERCGIPQQCMSAIGNHVELDKEHVEEGLDAIDGLVGDPAYLSPMRRVLRQSIQYFDGFLAEVAELPSSYQPGDVRAA